VCTTTATGSVGPNGGSVSSLYFAIVGDTRPGSDNDNSGYPTSIITKIFQDMVAMNPRPQFVLTTGDYQYDDPGSGNAAIQIGYYKSASQIWTNATPPTGPIFSAMGNHECNGFTSSNMTFSGGTFATGQCDGTTSDNYSEWFSNYVAPLGKTTPYYTIPVSATDGSWTAKFIIIACNAWDSTQQSWLQTQLNTPTTYTFPVRHEDPGAGSPCDSTVDQMLSSAKYDLLIVGHSHVFQNDISSKYIIVGNGGAGSGPYGYATIQQGSSGFTVTQYDYSTASPVSSFTFQ
jgi:hypothetical protein